MKHSKVRGAYCLGIFQNGKDPTTLLGGMLCFNDFLSFLFIYFFSFNPCHGFCVHFHVKLPTSFHKIYAVLLHMYPL